MRSAVMSIGSELVEGFLTDTNATFLAQEMAALGIELVEVFQVGDNQANIVRALRRAWEDVDLIVTTGGIGPTEDDLTRESIAELLNEPLAVDPDLLKTVEAFFASRGTTMPEQNAKQAWLIPSATPLPNPMGTAPGWFVHRDGHFIVSMPGVPREMRRMWREQAVPRLQPYFGDHAIVSRTIKTIGIGESAAEREIADIIRRGHPIVATYAKDDGVHIRITASAPSHSEAQLAVERTEAEIRDILGRFVYGDEQVSLGSALLQPLIDSGQTVAVSEAGSGGRITELLAEEPAAVVTYQGGIVRAFEQIAAVHGIDAAQPEATATVARTEAAAIRAQLRADYGLGIAVQLMPGATLDRTHGHIALCVSCARGMVERTHQVTAVPWEIRRRAALWAAEFLRLALLDEFPPST